MSRPPSARLLVVALAGVVSLAACVAGGASATAPAHGDPPAAAADDALGVPPTSPRDASATEPQQRESSPRESPEGGSPPGEPSPRETPACAAERAATLAAMQESRRTAACARAADCAVVTGPGHPDREYAEVVAARDAARLEARARAHLDTCGAFHVHEAIDAVRVIEARCDGGRCVAGETTLHLEEGMP